MNSIDTKDLPDPDDTDSDLNNDLESDSEDEGTIVHQGTSNAPASNKGQAVDDVEEDVADARAEQQRIALESVEDSNEEPQEQSGGSRRDRSRPRNARELLEGVPRRAEDSGDKLKVHLTGKTLFILRDSNERVLLDWSQSNLTAKITKESTADCTITISDNDLMRIASGELNPQILMLSHKVLVTGKADNAVYIFNLIAPYSHV